MNPSRRSFMQCSVLFSTIPLLVRCSSLEDVKPDSASVLETYASQLFALYQKATKDAIALQSAIQSFLLTPTDSTLATAKTSWLASREAYLHTEGARYYGGPIDGDPDYEAALNSWPLDEATIDYVTNTTINATDDNTGIINNTTKFPTISKAILRELNGKDGDTAITTGYHAIEFLLWGQALEPIGPGKRSALDFVSGPSGMHKNQERRRQYLTLVTEILVEDLSSVRDGWAPNSSNNYRSKFVKQSMNLAAQQVFLGLAKLAKAEMAGERIAVAMKSRDRRDQHDCFSSLSMIDYIRSVESIRKLYGEAAEGSKSPTFSELVRSYQASTDKKVLELTNNAIQSLKSVTDPFEKLILETGETASRKAVFQAIDTLQQLGDALIEAGRTLGATSLALPNG